MCYEGGYAEGGYAHAHSSLTYHLPAQINRGVVPFAAAAQLQLQRAHHPLNNWCSVTCTGDRRGWRQFYHLYHPPMTPACELVLTQWVLTQLVLTQWVLTQCVATVRTLPQVVLGGARWCSIV
jgi:hypothetical protein